MDITLWIQAAITMLSPFFLKAGEKAVETFGEKIAEKTLEKSFWQKTIIPLFLKDDEHKVIEQIESDEISPSEATKLLEDKLNKEAKVNPQLSSQIKSAFNFTSADLILAEQLLNSIQESKKKLVQLIIDRSSSGYEQEVQNELMIKHTKRRMDQYEKEFLKLIKNK